MHAFVTDVVDLDPSITVPSEPSRTMPFDAWATVMPTMCQWSPVTWRP